jgi:hypothetical protein
MNELAVVEFGENPVAAGDLGSRLITCIPYFRNINTLSYRDTFAIK